MVGRFQEHLEAIYGVEAPARAESYVVGREDAARLGARVGPSDDREQLLVVEEEDALNLALYLDPELLKRVTASDPQHLLEADLDGYCQVAEGVSHFVYLTVSASQDRHVSLLELEAQAEVDKFVLCLLHRWGEHALLWANELIRRLFLSVHYLPSLTPELRWRYQEANRLARNYCEKLLRFVRNRRLDALLAELRYSYRLGAEAKLRYLAAT